MALAGAASPETSEPRIRAPQTNDESSGNVLPRSACAVLSLPRDIPRCTVECCPEQNPATPSQGREEAACDLDTRRSRRRNPPASLTARCRQTQPQTHPRFPGASSVPGPTPYSAPECAQ